MSAHTPGPWLACEYPTADAWSVFAPDPSPHAEEGDLFLVVNELTEANAHYIVRACNAHENLLEACEAAADILDAIAADASQDPCVGRMAKRVRAAIRKAEG